ncbi:hypothetical protein MNAN1_003076 [Malassezia nana]|uniref:Uncharacterized protein n=1 Tax=Malassezia nana TaxID=180528 RepID=A0AAF0EP38_9BASI|nr:hypothetical protein MNAN1_003076 [Malassezia nana]
MEVTLAECDALCDEMDTSISTAFLGQIAPRRNEATDGALASLLATLRDKAQQRGDTMEELRTKSRQLEALVHERQDELDQYEHAALPVHHSRIDVHESLSPLLNESAFRACLATPKASLP